VHEIALDKNYRVHGSTNKEERIAVRRAVLDTIRRDFDAGLGDFWTLAMAETIRERLCRVLKPGNSLHVLITESLDTNLIANQLKIGAFSYENFFSFMNTILPKLCSPARDNDVQALARDISDDFIGRLAKVLNIVDNLSLDYTNYLLQISAPTMAANYKSYEEREFATLHPSFLPRTTEWWRRARASFLSTAPTSPPSSSQIYIRGLVELFITAPPLMDSSVPETLDLDTARIARTRSTTLRIITISAVLLTAKNLLKRDVRSSWKPIAQRMWTIPDSAAYLDTTGTQYITMIESCHALPPAVRNSLTGTVTRILADARASPALSHPVMKVLLQKLKNHVFSRLAAESSQERLRAETTAMEVLGGVGMIECVERVGSVVEELGNVRRVDWEGHGEWLERVGEGAAQEAQNA
jgi:hypothetical protein